MTWIITSTGKRFDLLEPKAAMVDLVDIGHALAQLCRFTGHTSTHYSVAQHSYIVAELVPHEHRLQALLHDATEAYVGDLAGPLKKMLPAYSEIEHNVWLAICEHFHIDPELAPCVKQADLVALATERRDLIRPHADQWECLKGIEPAPKHIFVWSAAEARRNFHYSLMEQLGTTHRRAHA